METTLEKVAGFVKRLYWPRANFLQTSNGATSKGMPIVLDRDGKIDSSMLDSADVGAILWAATAKTTPVDADTFPLSDTAAGNVIKKVTWANVKATLVATALTWLANVIIDSTAVSGNALRVIRNLTATSTDSPVVDIVQDHASDDQPVLRLQQDGTGKIVQAFDGASEIFVLLDGGDVAIGINSTVARLRVNDSTQLKARLLLSGQEYYAAGNTSTDGIAFLLGVNRSNNRQLWIADSAALAVNTTNPVLRLYPSTGDSTTQISSMATDAATFLPLTLVANKIEIYQPALGGEVLRLTSTATNDDARESVYQGRIATTGATLTTLHTFTVPATTTYAIEARVTARRTGGVSGTAEDGAYYILNAVYKNVAGVATIIGAVVQTVIGESVAGYDATLNVSGGATVLCQVTGVATTNITWHITSRVWQVGT